MPEALKVATETIAAATIAEVLRLVNFTFYITVSTRKSTSFSVVATLSQIFARLSMKLATSGSSLFSRNSVTFRRTAQNCETFNPAFSWASAALDSAANRA
jgi:hypothetical protein